MAKKELSHNEYSIALLKKESSFLVYLNHPHITQQLAMLDNPKSPILLMEKMWMSLTEFLSNNHSHHDKISILHDAACGLHYIHEKGIIHFDLTADNILLTENITAKLADFGQATFCQQNIRYLPKTFDHLPPETFKPHSKTRFSTKVDVFSFGCVTIHTFTQERPVPELEKYAETSEIGKYKKNSEVERRSVFVKKFKNNCNSIKLHDLTLRCLQDNPDYRPTIATLLSMLKECLTFEFGKFEIMHALWLVADDPKVHHLRSSFKNLATCFVKSDNIKITSA